MLDRYDQRLRQLESLLRVSRAITAQLDLTSVLNLVIEAAVDLLAGSSGLIALRDDDGVTRIYAAYGLARETWPAFDDLLATPLSDQQTLVRRLREAGAGIGLPLRHVSALPLVFRGATVGVIYVFRAALNVEFTAEEHQLLTAFADQAAIAVSNARLFQSVLREKQHLDALIENSADGVMILDERWRIATFNRAMELLTGWSREEAIGRPCAEVLAIHTPQGANLCLTDCPLQRQPFEPNPVAEGWITTRDGRRLYIQSRYAAQRNSQGAFLGAIANVRDVTEQKIEAEMQNTFISVISHELRTPVSIIKGYAETLARQDTTWDAATLREGLAIIIEEADRLAQQINTLLEASRLQTDSMRLELSDWAVRPLVERVVERFVPQAGERFTFAIDIPDDFPPVHADYERTRTVLENLVSNAIKYSPNGGLIRIAARMSGDFAIISVSDQGIGIPPEEQKKLFRRFYRVDNRLRRETQGAGLGLFLSRVIVEAQGGRIWVDSRPGRGSRFSFTIPLATPVLSDQVTINETDAAMSVAHAEPAIEVTPRGEPPLLEDHEC